MIENDKNFQSNLALYELDQSTKTQVRTSEINLVYFLPICLACKPWTN